ncbi:hypothetical protein HK104_010262 [Borealophlyctis nickersoniae]|nr:hypothetical protein HK104_010262 [Borealophlyctis nickersoniae]
MEADADLVRPQEHDDGNIAPSPHPPAVTLPTLSVEQIELQTADAALTTPEAGSVLATSDNLGNKTAHCPSPPSVPFPSSPVPGTRDLALSRPLEDHDDDDEELWSRPRRRSWSAESIITIMTFSAYEQADPGEGIGGVDAIEEEGVHPESPVWVENRLAVADLTVSITPTPTTATTPTPTSSVPTTNLPMELHPSASVEKPSIESLQTADTQEPSRPRPESRVHLQGLHATLEEVLSYTRKQELRMSRESGIGSSIGSIASTDEKESGEDGGGDRSSFLSRKRTCSTVRSEADVIPEEGSEASEASEGSNQGTEVEAKPSVEPNTSGGRDTEILLKELDGHLEQLQLDVLDLERLELELQEPDDGPSRNGSGRVAGSESDESRADEEHLGALVHHLRQSSSYSSFASSIGGRSLSTLSIASSASSCWRSTPNLLGTESSSMQTLDDDSDDEDDHISRRPLTFASDGKLPSFGFVDDEQPRRRASLNAEKSKLGHHYGTASASTTVLELRSLDAQPPMPTAPLPPTPKASHPPSLGRMDIDGADDDDDADKGREAFSGNVKALRTLGIINDKPGSRQSMVPSPTADRPKAERRGSNRSARDLKLEGTAGPAVRDLKSQSLMQGYMSKLPSKRLFGRQGWKKRYYLLTRTHLLCFKSNGDAERASQSMPLEDAEVFVSGDPHFKGKAVLDIRSGPEPGARKEDGEGTYRSWILLCDDQESMLAWLRALKGAVAREKVVRTSWKAQSQQQQLPPSPPVSPPPSPTGMSSAPQIDPAPPSRHRDSAMVLNRPRSTPPGPRPGHAMLGRSSSTGSINMMQPPSPPLPRSSSTLSVHSIYQQQNASSPLLLRTISYDLNRRTSTSSSATVISDSSSLATTASATPSVSSLSSRNQGNGTTATTKVSLLNVPSPIDSAIAVLDMLERQEKRRSNRPESTSSEPKSGGEDVGTSFIPRGSERNSGSSQGSGGGGSQHRLSQLSSSDWLAGFKDSGRRGSLASMGPDLHSIIEETEKE